MIGRRPHRSPRRDYGKRQGDSGRPESANRRISISRAQASLRAATRTARSRARAGSSMLSRTRHAVAFEATDPNRPGCYRNTARSAMASPPSASNTATSTAGRERPGPPSQTRRLRSMATTRCCAAGQPHLQRPGPMIMSTLIVCATRSRTRRSTMPHWLRPPVIWGPQASRRMVRPSIRSR